MSIENDNQNSIVELDHNVVLHGLVYAVTVVMLIFALTYTIVGKEEMVERYDNVLIQLGLKEIEEEDVIVKEVLESNYEFNDNGRIGVGVYLPDLTIQTTYPTDFQLLLDHEDLVKKKMEYLLLFQAWDDNPEFPIESFDDIKELELIPIITWEPWKQDFVNPTDLQSAYSLSGIADGRHDLYIREWAKDAKETEYPIIVRFAHEQSTEQGVRSWYPWQGDPENYILAFRRISNIFKAVGADNVSFMWNPMGIEEKIKPYYPGEEYVDYIGLTVLNHGEVEDFNLTWSSCDDTFAAQYAWAQPYGHPIIVTEFASAEGGGEKDLWFADCLAKVANSPEVIGLITVEIPQDAKYPSINWKTDSSSKSLLEFQNWISLEVYK